MNKSQCPQCGASIDYQNKDIMFYCDFCHSILLIETLVDKQSLQIPLQKTLVIHGEKYQVKNLIQWIHSNGVRAEYLLQNTKGLEFILSKDDESVSLVQKIIGLDLKCDKPLDWNSLEPNSQVIINDFNWLVTEKRVMKTYDEHEYYFSYLTGVNAELLVLVFKSLNQKSLIEIRTGSWLDSFDIQIENR